MVKAKNPAEAAENWAAAVSDTAIHDKWANNFGKSRTASLYVQKMSAFLGRDISGSRPARQFTAAVAAAQNLKSKYASGVTANGVKEKYLENFVGAFV